MSGKNIRGLIHNDKTFKTVKEIEKIKSLEDDFETGNQCLEGEYWERFYNRLERFFKHILYLK